MGTCLLEKTTLNDDEESGEWVNIWWLPYPSYLAYLLVDLNHVYSLIAIVVMNCMQVKFWGCLEVCSLSFRSLLIAMWAFIWVYPFLFPCFSLSIVHLQNVYYDSILSVPQRSHIVLTITNPSESLLNELRTVEVCLCIYFFYLIPLSL